MLQLRLGQMLDLETQDVNKFSLERYESIVQFKTSCYTFYLPVAISMILTKNDTPESLQACEEISNVLGLLFQVQVNIIMNFYSFFLILSKKFLLF